MAMDRKDALGDGKWSTKAIIIVTSVITAVFGGVVSLGVNYYGGLWAKQDEVQFEEVSKFAEGSKKFNTEAASVLRSSIYGDPKSEKRDELQRILIEQHENAEVAKTRLEGRELERALRYQELLGEISDELSKNATGENLESLYQVVADAEYLEGCVLRDLRDEAGIETNELDDKDCSEALRYDGFIKR
ncbi:hypothetical protein [Erythrobacter aureus]|uniref:hypothetical protein n=1 Tax=Erythrobacter aureus TaxID=2182384 RepID=UPI003A8FE1C9